MNVLLRLVLWLLALVVVSLPVVAVMGGWVGAERWPLSRLRVQAPEHHVRGEQIREIVLPYAQAGYFAVDLQAAQDAVERLAWVETVKVRKQWPDVLEVELTEHRPFARWGDDRLLSEQGKLIPVPEGLDVSDLPDLGGPDNRTEEVVALYEYARDLFAGSGMPLERVRMDARGSWEIRLAGGIDVMVGRHEARARLARFIRVLPQLVAVQKTPIVRADLRYTNGFTLSWADRVPGKTQDRT